MVRIYHNPRCRKSREALQRLEESGCEFEVVKYLENIPSTSELDDILKQLNMEPLDLIRKKEAIFRENFKGKDLSRKEWIEVMIQNPRLIERPIIIHRNKAVVARPAEKMDEIL